MNTTVEHSPTLATTHQGEPIIALDGDKLKPREDQRKGGNGFGVNEEGAGYPLTAVDRHGVAYCAAGGEVASTITRQISEQSGQDNRANAVVQCYENHWQDCRIKQIEVSDTRTQRDGTGGNNLPLVCFSKVSHPSAPNGEGERWYERGVAQTRNTFDNGEKRCQEVVVSTNSKGGDVAPTVNANMSKFGGDNQTTFGGGYVVTRQEQPKAQSARN